MFAGDPGLVPIIGAPQVDYTVYLPYRESKANGRLDLTSFAKTGSRAVTMDRDSDGIDIVNQLTITLNLAYYNFTTDMLYI